PLLSRHSLIRAERYFRREWEAAFDKASGLPASVQFIFPVAIEDVPYQHQELPSRLSDLSWFSIAKGLNDDFVNAVKARYKKNQGDGDGMIDTARGGALMPSRVDAQNPWRGPEAFHGADAPSFFGRDRARNEGARLLLQNRLVILYGRSGLGKTSLLRAG